MQEPTRRDSGKAERWREHERTASISPAGVLATACSKGDQTQHGKPQR